LHSGITGLVLLIPLAITSNNWRRLHWLVYPAVLLGVIHYLWQMKVISAEGWTWAAVLVALLVSRFRKIPLLSRR